MPLESFQTHKENISFKKSLYKKYRILDNPFPSGSHTMENPHTSLSEEIEKKIDRKVIDFYETQTSQVVVITATQGIGKTNLLNAYEKSLKKVLASEGYFVIRYIADPDPSFDSLLRGILDEFGLEHFQSIIASLKTLSSSRRESLLSNINTLDVRKAINALTMKPDIKNEEIEAFFKWTMGLPPRKLHNEVFKIFFRLDTTESKNRALRDIIYLSAELNLLKGIFLLLDELEKHDMSLAKTTVNRYLSALRAFTDALPKYLFLMIALTPDALTRYKEMIPALRGRLSGELQIPSLGLRLAIQLYKFYLDEAENKAKKVALEKGWKISSSSMSHIISEDEARMIYEDLNKISTIEGVRQRDFLIKLHELAEERSNKSLEPE